MVEAVEHALDQRRANLADDAVVLKGLARDVQRQVLGIDQSAEESEVFGHQLAAVALDQHALGAQVQAVLEPGEPQVFEVGRRAIDDRAELDRRVGRQVQMPERLFLGVVGQVLVKPGVLLLGDLALGLDPDRLLIVDDLAAGPQPDRIGNEARDSAGRSP